MTTNTLQAEQADFQGITEKTSGKGGFKLLAGFIHHYQNAQRIQREAHRLYRTTDAELNANGHTRESMARQLATLYHD